MCFIQYCLGNLTLQKKTSFILLRYQTPFFPSERAERSDFLLPELIFSDVKQFIPRQETILQVVENTGNSIIAEALSGVVQSKTLDAISLTSFTSTHELNFCSANIPKSNTEVKVL